MLLTPRAAQAAAPGAAASRSASAAEATEAGSQAPSPACRPIEAKAPRCGVSLPGPYLGDALRWPKADLPTRFLADLAAIPLNLPRWTGEDVGTFVLFATPVLFLMVGPDPVPDVQIQRWVQAIFGPREQRFQLWTPLGDVLVWSGIWSLVGAAWLHGTLAGAPEYLEMVSLMLEAFGLAQVYQLFFKFLLGREGPKDGDGLARIHGPAKFFELFPAGTPSGHVATLYALMGAAGTYWAKPWLYAALMGFGLLFSATIVIDDYHFVSDVLWGAAMGWYLGRWVVRHRARPSRSGVDAMAPAALLPAALPGGGVGLAAAWTF